MSDIKKKQDFADNTVGCAKGITVVHEFPVWNMQFAFIHVQSTDVIFGIPTLILLQS